VAKQIQYWLMKSEPDVYGIDDLERDGATDWEGVRNYQARNYMRDAMRVGDRVLFYHSSTTPPGVAGVGEVARAAAADPSAWDPAGPYFDPKSTPEAPRWVTVRLSFVEQFPAVVPLQTLRDDPRLDGMLVTRRGQRLSIQPVSAPHFRRVLRLGRAGGHSAG
jgi:predicted RNA-binding protein with PUA-like domain